MSGVKHDQDKVRMELLPWPALEEIARVLTFGAAKYDPWNWASGFQWSRLIGAALRHLAAWVRGEGKDPETGLSHLAHAGCCILFLLTHEIENLGEDDRHDFKTHSRNTRSSTEENLQDPPSQRPSNEEVPKSCGQRCQCGALKCQ